MANKVVFRTLIYVLAAIGGIAVVVAVAVAIAYAIVVRRLALRMQETVDEMEAFLAQTIEGHAWQSTESAFESVSIPPMRIHLEVAAPNERPGAELELVDRIHHWLLAHSFEFIGDFVIDELDSERLSVYLSEDRHLVSAIRFPTGSTMPYVEFLFDVGRHRRGGVSNPPDTTLQLPEDAIGKFFSGNLKERFELLSQMWLEAKDLLDVHDAFAITPSALPAFYEEAHAAEMDYRVAAGGLSEDEIRTSLVAQGERPTDQDVNAIQRQWQNAIETHLLEYSSRGLNHSQAGHEILIVYDGSAAPYLLSRIFVALDPLGAKTRTQDWPEAMLELQGLLEQFSPREAVARFRPLLPNEMRYELVDQLRYPIDADLYVLPSVRKTRRLSSQTSG